MARIVDGGERKAGREKNPVMFGFDMVELAEYGFGAVGTGYANDKYIGPALKGMIPGAGTMSQVADALTTLASAWGVGKLAGFVNKPLGRRMMVGGGILGVARLFGAFVPGYSLSVTYPNFTLFSGAPAPRALNSGNTAAGGVISSPASSVAL